MLQCTKRFLNLLLCICMLVIMLPQLRFTVTASGSLSAMERATAVLHQGNCGENATWTLGESGTLVITGTGDMADYGSASDVPWYSIRSSIKRVEVGAGITTIGDRAFYNCTALEGVNISSNVTTIGDYAFRGCTLLKALTIPAGVTAIEASAFRACTGLESLCMEGNAPTVGKYAFNEISKTITIQYYEGSNGYDAIPWCDFTHNPMHRGTWVVITPATCTANGSRELWCSYCQKTFREILVAGHRYVDGVCTQCNHVRILGKGSCGSNLQWQLDGLGTLTINGNGNMYYYTHPLIFDDVAPWYEQRKAITNVVIQNGVTGIGDHAFYDCSNLVSVTIPDSVISIGSSAFEGCRRLAAIAIPDGVTSIGSYAFSNCSSLTSVTIPDGVTGIASGMFDHCSSLTSVVIPEGVSSIDSSAFYNCSSLTSVKIPESVTGIGSSAFFGCSGLTSLVIPQGVTKIGIQAFFGCSSLTSVTIPESVTSIREDTFVGCKSLTAVTIPESVTSIGRAAFYNCSGLKTITIPESVTSIGDTAFYRCSKLESIIIPESVTGIEENTFSGCSSLREITIPASVSKIDQLAFERCSSLTKITFLGAAPKMAGDCYSGVTAQAYYPCGNETWNNTIHATYGGNLTWRKYHVFENNGNTQNSTCIFCGENDVKIGDISGDGKINILDIAMLYSHIKRSATISDEEILSRADVNGDGKVNIADAGRLYASVRSGW